MSNKMGMVDSIRHGSDRPNLNGDFKGGVNNRIGVVVLTNKQRSDC